MQYYIKTFGCQMNFSDSERMMTFFEKAGFSPADKMEKADLVIFNSCGVRQTAEDRVYGLVHNLRLANPDSTIVVTGCLAHRPDVQKKLSGKVDLFIPIHEFPQLFGQPALEKLLPSLSPTPNSQQHYLCIQPKYKYTDQAFVPIMTGCNNFCAYCVVPYARGREWSRPTEDIVKEIDILAKKGCQEVTLLGQNVNSYKYSDNSFPTLLQILAQQFPSITFKFLTSHPKDFSDKLMQVIASQDNISKDIHLPIQSGSDQILKAMNRPYTQQHYLNLIEQARKTIPHVRFSTDVIVGFPGETEEDFRQTVNVFEKVGFYEAFINKYSPRPGTAAHSLGDPISWAEKKHREKILRQYISI